MQNILVMIVLAVIVFFAARGTLKHFRGQGGCCGGSSVKAPKKKLEGKILHTYLLDIEGMHCENCAGSVTRGINAIEGAVGKVSLLSGSAKVICDRDIDGETLRYAVEQRGYRVTGIRELTRRPPT